MNQDISPAAAAILDGLNDVLKDVQGLPVEGMRKTVIYPVKPKEIRENLKMSQQEFASAYGIPLSTLRNWEQGRRKLDTTAIAYFRAIMKYPTEVMNAQLT